MSGKPSSSSARALRRAVCGELSARGSVSCVVWRGSLPFLVEDKRDLHFLLCVGEDEGEGEEGENELDGLGCVDGSAAVCESQDLLNSCRRREYTSSNLFFPPPLSHSVSSFIPFSFVVT